MSSSTPLTIPPHLRTWAEIDLEAIVHNARIAREKTGTDVMGIVKANAYGHGAPEVARALIDSVVMYGVATLDEAQELMSWQLPHPILLLGPCLPSERLDAVRLGAICTVSSAAEAAAYSALDTEMPALLNFKIDTGMGRIGTWQGDALAELALIVQLPHVELRMISTHLPVADEDEAFSKGQLAHFEKLAASFRTLAPHSQIHSLNSSGILGYPQYAQNFVRAGLMLYGSAYPADFQPLLRPALSWKARISLVRDVGPGRSISYGRSFITSGTMRIATIPVGYADGFPRQASGQGAHVLIGGRRCPVLGRVTMDQILVDVSAAGQVVAGDEVVIIGEQGTERILARELADAAGTITWDIFTGLGSRVKRLYLNQPLTAK